MTDLSDALRLAEASRRVGWAKFYAAQEELEQEQARHRDSLERGRQWAGLGAVLLLQLRDRGGRALAKKMLASNLDLYESDHALYQHAAVGEEYADTVLRRTGAWDRCPRGTGWPS